MGVEQAVGFALLSWNAALCLAGQTPLAGGKAQSVDPAVQSLLREASEIALKQDEAQAYWCDQVLLQIGEIQVRAGDFDGALRSIRSSRYPYGRSTGLLRLAEGLARDGKRDRAFEIARALESDSGWPIRWAGDSVQLRWIEYLIASGGLERGEKGIDQLKSKSSHAEARRQLAVAYAKSEEAVRANAQFALALEAASGVKDDVRRARAMSEIADAQQSVGKADAVKATIRRLADTERFSDPWATFTVLKASAVLAAKAGNEKTARQLFLQAIEARTAVHRDNKLDAIRQTAQAQASVGYVEDALKTAWMIEHSDKYFGQDADREQALYSIATAQLKANDVEGAVRTALTIEHFLQYRDDSLRAVVEHLIAKKDLKAALRTCQQFVNPSRKACAILLVATVHAKNGEPKLAREVAARIELASRDAYLPIGREDRFDYRNPRTWGVNYDASNVFTISSHLRSLERTAEVAAAAMTFAQAIGQVPDQSYSALFNDVNTNQVTQALARSHAASGDAKEAIAWAKQIGSSAKIGSEGNSDVARAVEQRIHALMGVAEGILDRADQTAR
jgi:hypothetical protein